jgi:predicted PurR-regulated permease PerM
VACAVVAFILLVTLRLSEVLPIVVVAVILAYVFTPIVNLIDRYVLVFGPFAGKGNRNLATLLAYVVIILGVVVVLLVLVPVILEQFEDLGRLLPSLLRDLERALEAALSQPVMFNGQPILIDGRELIPLERLRELTGAQRLTDVIQFQDIDLVNTTQSFFSSLTGPAFSFVGGVATAAINVVLLLSMMFFLMRDGSAFVDRGVRLTPQPYQGDMRRIFYELGRVWNAYLRGQLTLALLMGVLSFVAATLVGLPNPAIIGVISGVFEFVPSVGSGLAIFPAALLALTSTSSTMPGLEGGAFALVAIIIWAALQNLEAIILVPRVMGGSLNLHPLAIILGLIFGAALAGLLGVILAAPTVATLRVFGQYIYGKLMDTEPFPAPRHRSNRLPRTMVTIRRAINQLRQQSESVRARLDAIRRGNHV